jgi:hypothetical protein
MQAVSDRFLELLGRGAELAFRLEVLLGGAVVFASEEVILSGSLTVESTADVRRRARVQVVDETGEVDQYLGTEGQEVRLFRGLVVDGEAELVPLLTGGAWDRPARRGVFEVGVFDRARTVSSRTWVDPYVVDAGQTYDAAITAGLLDRMPELADLLVDGAFPGFATSTFTTPLMIFDSKSDPWKGLAGMAADAGLELLFDPLGAPILQPVPDVSTSPVVAHYHQGTGGALISGDKGRTREGTFTGAVCDAESPSNAVPFRSVRWDEDPTSPTYYLGPLGQVPYFFTAPATTQAQTDAAAEARLRQVVGRTEVVDFSTIPNPALAEGDVVRLTSEVDPTFDEIHVLDAFELALFGKALTGRTRARRVLL